MKHIFQKSTLCCGITLELPQNGSFNEIPQHVFFKKIPSLYFVSKFYAYLQLWFAQMNLITVCRTLD